MSSLLYDVEPVSRRSLKSLLAAVRESPTHAGLIRKLRFPQFDLLYDGSFRQMRYHRDRFPGVLVYEESVAIAHIKESVIDALAAIFFDIVDHCPNLIMLDLPLYRIGNWCPDPSKLSLCGNSIASRTYTGSSWTAGGFGSRLAV